eukprot:SAG22_NODE_17671_length_300_cov_1.288557_1_plen_73_part_01
MGGRKLLGEGIPPVLADKRQSTSFLPASMATPYGQLRPAPYAAASRMQQVVGRRPHHGCSKLSGRAAALASTG